MANLKKKIKTLVAVILSASIVTTWGYSCLYNKSKVPPQIVKQEQKIEQPKEEFFDVPNCKDYQMYDPIAYDNLVVFSAVSKGYLTPNDLQRGHTVPRSFYNESENPGLMKRICESVDTNNNRLIEEDEISDYYSKINPY